MTKDAATKPLLRYLTTVSSTPGLRLGDGLGTLRRHYDRDAAGISFIGALSVLPQPLMSLSSTTRS